MWERLQRADAAIVDAHAAVREHTKLTRDRARVQEDLRRAREREASLTEQVDEELQDVERLEGGWGALLHRVLGDRDERLSAERREHAEAALQLDAARAHVAGLEGRVQEIERRLAALGEPAGILATARGHKAELLHELDDPRADELTRITEALGDVAADERELEEAITAAETAAAWLQDADGQLSRAASWGTWDMFGGGMMSSMAKRGRMQDARASLHHAATALHALDSELADVAVDVRDAPQLDTGGLTGLMDVVFDNMITDWLVQGRIRDARSAVHDVARQVAGIATQLGQVARDLQQRRSDLTGQRQALLDQPG